MIRTLRALFLSRLLREKVLLLALALGIVIFWFSNWSGRMGRFWTEQQRTTAGLATQKLWLTNRGAIEKAAAAAAKSLDPAQTLNASRLVATVHSLADDAGLAGFTVGAPDDVTSGQFAVHTVTFSDTKVSWHLLQVFYVSLRDKAPYLTIESMAIAPERADPTLLDINFKISSVDQPGS